MDFLKGKEPNKITSFSQRVSPSFWHIVRCRWNILPKLTVWGGDNWGGREIKVKATSHDWYGSSPELLGSPLCGFDTSPFWHRLQECWNNEPFADGTRATVTRDYCPVALRLARDWCGQSVLIRFVRWKLNTYFWDRQMAERKREECVCLFVSSCICCLLFLFCGTTEWSRGLARARRALYCYPMSVVKDTYLLVENGGRSNLILENSTNVLTKDCGHHLTN